MMAGEEEIEGARVLVDALKEQGIEYMFGVVGIPVVEVAVFAQQAGIHYIGMRNEQSAAYAAQAIGYLTGTPGVCLCVSGPGVLHAVGGLANAVANCWPMILIGGASDEDQQGRGAFQEWDQVSACRPYCKYTTRPPSIASLHYHVAQAVKHSISGRPGPVYLDFPGNLLRETVPASSVAKISRYPRAMLPQAADAAVLSAVAVLKAAKRPLIVVGKGAAQARAEAAVRELVSRTGAPFLPTPMGKGVVSDVDSQCVSACRSTALSSADCVLLLGARTNWMLHFAAPPRFNKSVQIIQVDVSAEEHCSSVASAVTLLGDVGLVCTQLTPHLGRLTDQRSEWWQLLNNAKHENALSIQEAVSSECEAPLGYYAVFDTLSSLLPSDCIIATEGANTMDIGRSFLNNSEPRHRLDAGTFGTMGVGLAYAIAASVWQSVSAGGKRIVCIEGDSAFGFSGMEIETMFRYKLPVILIIINNNGIYGGLTGTMLDELRECAPATLTTPPTTLTPDVRYNRMMDMFGGRGFHCETLTDIKDAMTQALTETEAPCLINISINPFAQRKSQKFDWLTRTPQARL